MIPQKKQHTPSKRFKFFTTSFLIVLATAPLLFSQDFTREQVVTQMIMKYLAGAHFSPLSIDDTLSTRAFNLFIKRLDSGKRFLLQKDIDTLKKYELTLDDELRKGRMDFFHMATTLLEKRVHETQNIVNTIFAKPLDFSKTDSLEMDAEKRDYCKSAAELEQRWRHILTYQTTLRYFDSITEELDSTVWNTNAFNPAQSFRPELARKAQEREHRSIERFFKRIVKQDKDNLVALYINTFVNSFDPHSSYMPPARKEDFDIAMTGRLEGIGAVLQEDDGYIKVVRIVPGSASWRQKELKTDDIILKVGQGKNEAEDIVEMMLSEAVKLIRGKKGTEVRLTVKKKDGRIMVIPIIRDIVIIEETYARSAIVSQGATGTRYGYIYLPRFYHDFNRQGARNSSDDIRKELDKFKQEKVHGIIIDLRDNTGGSLDDAVKMAGLFIKTGPIVQSRGRLAKSEVLRDNDAKVHFEGPLVVLQNSHSASASEIVAAALQDYKRAIVVGPKHSFGKGTVQRLMGLDNGLSYRFKQFLPLGSLKITIQKFYRINGGATQYKGVEADIIIPDPGDFVQTGEKEMDYSLPWDTVTPLTYIPWNKFSYDIPKLRKASAARVQKSVVFADMKTRTEALKKRREHTKEQLGLSVVWKRRRKLQETIRTGRETGKKHINITVAALSVDAAKIGDDKEKLEKMRDWQEQRQYDVQLNEALHILNDITQKK